MKRFKLLTLAWALVVGLLLIHSSSLLLNKKFAPDTDILALLPMQERDPVLQQAFNRMVESAQQRLVVLIGADDWDKARLAADAYRAVLAQHSALFDVVDTQSDQSQQEWLTLIRKHRLVLMTSQQESALRSQTAQFWSDTALSKLYSPFAGPNIVAWRDDPFGLFGNWLQARAQETPVRPRDGKLFVSGGDRQYVVLPMTLRVPSFSFGAQQEVMPVLAQARQAAVNASSGVEVMAAGVILHAAAAGEQARWEMSLIGTGSFAGIILLTWLAFRSVKPIVLVFVSVATGFLGAFSVCSLIFEKVHLLTLVFGASLIGVAQDYGIYFMCNRLAGGAATDSWQLLRRLLPGLMLTLVAALIGYAGLALTPFPGLRQMALFSTLGLVFAWMTVVCWFPALIGPHTLRGTGLAHRYGASLVYWPALRLNRKSLPVIGLLIAGAVYGCVRLEANDDIRLLQNSPPDLLAEQFKLSKLLDTPAPSQFYLVRGASPEQVLQREEKLKERLDRLIASGTITGYQAISNWVPSAATQAARQQLVREKLLADGAALTILAGKLDEAPAWVEGTRSRLTQESALLTPDAFLQTPAGEPWRHLWLGKINDSHASIVALRSLTPAVLPALSSAANDIDGIQWVDKVEEISSVLGRYREYMGRVLLLSYMAVFVLLYVRYRASAWRVLLPVALASIAALALLGLAGQKLQLFHVLALMLLLGIGIDYGVFLHERSTRRDDISWLAVGLSAASTLLSFGLLGLSRTPALQAFGMTMLIGTGLTWLVGPCFLNKPPVKAVPTPLEELCVQE